MLPVAYLLLCVVTGLLARHTVIGFWGFFFLSILFTPLVGLAIIIVASRKTPRRAHNLEVSSRQS
jgi:hypothetical protein